jgi:hypothetical protein
MDLGNGLGHLTYSTLVHPGDTWQQMFESLQHYLPKVKQRVSPREPFGVCIRLSARAAKTLVEAASERERLKKFLGDGDMYLYTANAFPYGDFKSGPVKERVYEPDWRTAERTQYTKNVATILADVAPEGTSPSIQSSPLGFKPNVKGPKDVTSFTDHVLQVAAHLVDLEPSTGRTVTLALEPEPMCFLETTDEAVRYFTDHLYAGASAETLARSARMPVSEAIAALRRHIGVVFDICHQAIEFEDISASLQKLVDAGVPIFKLQEAAAVHIPNVDQKAVDSLSRFAETVYLTQTVQRKGGRIERFLNLENAFSDWNDRSAGEEPSAREWRVHFHVPVFLEDLGAFRTTRFAIEEALAFHKRTPLSRQLEIETYTWDVLPAHLKTGDITDYVCREIEWVRAQLA